MSLCSRLRRNVLPAAFDLTAPLLARIAASALQAVTMILLARASGPTDFGYFAASLGIGTVAGSLLGFGSSAQALRLMATEQPKRLATTLLLLRLWTAAAVAGIILAVFWAKPADAVAVAAIYAATEVTSELGQSVMLGMQRTALAHVAIFLRRAIPMALLLAADPLGWTPSQGLGVGWIVSGVLTLAFCWRLVARPLPVATVLRGGLHFWSSTSLVNLQNLDVVLVQSVGGSALGGNYGAASRVVSPLNLFTATILSILTPKLAAAPDPGERARLFRNGQLALLGYLAVLAAAAPFAYWLGPWVLGPGYGEAAPLFAAFTIAAGISGLSQIHVSLLYALDLARSVALARLGAIPAGLAILLAATHVGGIYGASAGIIVMQAIPVVILHRMVRSRKLVLKKTGS